MSNLASINDYFKSNNDDSYLLAANKNGELCIIECVEEKDYFKKNLNENIKDLYLAIIDDFRRSITSKINKLSYSYSQDLENEINDLINYYNASYPGLNLPLLNERITRIGYQLDDNVYFKQLILYALNNISGTYPNPNKCIFLASNPNGFFSIYMANYWLAKDIEKELDKNKSFSSLPNGKIYPACNDEIGDMLSNNFDLDNQNNISFINNFILKNNKSYNSWTKEGIIKSKYQFDIPLNKTFFSMTDLYKLLCMSYKNYENYGITTLNSNLAYKQCIRLDTLKTKSSNLEDIVLHELNTILPKKSDFGCSYIIDDYDMDGLFVTYYWDLEKCLDILKEENIVIHYNSSSSAYRIKNDNTNKKLINQLRHIKGLDPIDFEDNFY